jgi:ketosteroid isomerase-like protein
MLVVFYRGRSVNDTDTVLDHHLDAFASQDLEEIMVDYAEDSTVVTNLGVYRGLDGIEELFVGLFEEFSQDGTTLEVDDTIVEDDFAYLLWHAETPDQVYEFCTDTFYIPENTIEFQTYAGKIESKD